VKPVLDLLAEALAPQHPEAMLVGGQALPAYGVVRQTLDVDCLATEQGANKLHAALVAAGYVEAGRSSAVVRYRHESPWLLDVDVLLVDAPTYDGLLQDAKPWQRGTTIWHVPSLPHLIALKLHAIKYNPQRKGHDLTDIVALLQQNPGAVTKTALREMCEKFGPAGFFEQLENVQP
jgi:hypothetical protein